ncbi:MAG: hypothetical protein VX726_13905 [Planctomycetota bacterium]|nr:hypothetical protein [Planctomycetota bacterium]
MTHAATSTVAHACHAVPSLGQMSPQLAADLTTVAVTAVMVAIAMVGLRWRLAAGGVPRS